MEISLKEAARLLGKTDRQVRYLLQQGELPGKKTGGRWIISRDDLPLSEGQAKAAKKKNEDAARIAVEILQPGEEKSKKSLSLRELRAIQVALGRTSRASITRFSLNSWFRACATVESPIYLPRLPDHQTGLRSG